MTRRLEPPNDVMRAALEKALRRRVVDRSDGKVTLPVGVADVAEVGKVIGALDCARSATPTTNSNSRAVRDRCAETGKLPPEPPAVPIATKESEMLRAVVKPLSTTTKAPLPPPPPSPRPVSHRAEVTIVEARRHSAGIRVDMAARYLAGVLTVTPTGVLARYVFRVPITKIRAALNKLDISPAAPSDLDRAWDNAASDDRAAFLRKHAGQLWRTLDQLTSP